MSLFLPGSASLVEQLDTRVLVVLRDGRNLVGVLRSFDQFSNIVLQDTAERRVVNGMYGDIPLGIYIVRGENIVLLGEINEEVEAAQSHLRRVSVDEILEAEDEAASAGRLEKTEWDIE